MQIDSTCSYADKEGFRCGTVDKYSVFNILTRKKLKLKEMPLVVMEVSMIGYQNMSPDDIEEKIVKLINRVKKYNGNFVLLWHNSNFNTEIYKKYQSIYKKVLKYC